MLPLTDTPQSSVYNMIYLWSVSLFHLALTSNSSILHNVFLEASGNICTFIGYNLRFGCRHIKVYKEEECLFANILRDVLLLPSSNGHICMVGTAGTLLC